MSAASPSLSSQGLLLATSKDVIDLQCAQNKVDAEKREADKFKNITLHRIALDISEALRGSMSDVLNHGTLTMGQTRLRGLGFLLLIFAMAGLVYLGAVTI